MLIWLLWRHLHFELSRCRHRPWGCWSPGTSSRAWTIGSISHTGIQTVIMVDIFFCNIWMFLHFSLISFFFFFFFNVQTGAIKLLLEAPGAKMLNGDLILQFCFECNLTCLNTLGTMRKIWHSIYLYLTCLSRCTLFGRVLLIGRILHLIIMGFEVVEQLVGVDADGGGSCFSINIHLLQHTYEGSHIIKMRQSSQIPIMIRWLLNSSDSRDGIFWLIMHIDPWAPSQYKDRLIYVWRFPC